MWYFVYYVDHILIYGAAVVHVFNVVWSFRDNFIVIVHILTVYAISVVFGFVSHTLFINFFILFFHGYVFSTITVQDFLIF